MKLLIANAKKADTFTQMFANLKGLTEAITFRFNEENIYIQGMDLSHVALYEILLDKYWFEAYKLNSGDSKVISISLDILSKVLAMRQKNQIILIDFDNNPDKLNIQFKSIKPNAKEYPKEYSLPLMEIDSELLDIPDVEYEVDFTINAKTFSLLVGQLENFDETVKMSFSEEAINFTAEGDTSGSMKADLYSKDVDYVEEFCIGEECEMNISFSLKYINQFCQFEKLSQMIILHLSENYPMQMKYNIDEKSYMRFMLAPKIDD